MRFKISSYTLLSAYTLFSFACVLAVPVPDKNAWAYIYLRILMASLSLIALYSLFRSVKKCGERRRHLYDIWIPLVLVGLAAWLRFRYVTGYDLWYDEDTQIRGVLHDKDLLFFAASHTQPPIHFFQMKLVFDWLNVSLFSARLPSALFGSLAIWPLYSILRTFARLELALFGTLLFIGSDLALSYSQEARPYMAGCLLFLLYLRFWLESVDPAASIESVLALAVTQILLFITLSMQPQTMFAFQILSLFIFSSLRGFSWRLVKSTAVAAIFSFPVLYLAAEDLSTSPHVQPFKAGFLWKNWPSFLDSLQKTLGPLLYAYPIFLAIAFWRGREKLRMKDPLFALLLLTLVYPWLFYVSFESLMSYPIYERYILFYLPLYLVALVYALENTFPRGKIIWGAALAAVILPFTFASKGTLKYEEPIWRNFFTYAEERESKPGLAIVLDLQASGYRQNSFLGIDLYYSPELRAKTKMRLGYNNTELEAHADLIYRLAENPNSNYLYILLLSNAPISSSPLGSLSDGTRIISEDFYLGRYSRLVRIDSAPRPLIPGTAKYLAQLAEKNPAIRQMPWYRALMAGLSALRGNCAEARRQWTTVPSPPRRPARTRISHEYIKVLIERKCASSA